MKYQYNTREHLLNSHDLFHWLCIAIARENVMLIPIKGLLSASELIFLLLFIFSLCLFPASNEGELSVNEGDELVILEQDLDNSGWTKVLKDEDEGYVPSSYIEMI